MESKALRVAVVGGGVGGLTAALCLESVGCEVTVFEQGSALAEVGAGLQLSPNCARVLHRLGLEDSLKQVSFLPQGVEMRSWQKGHVIASNPLGDEAIRRFGFPYYHIHRADLMAILADAVASKSIRLQTGARVVSWQTKGDKLTVVTSDDSRDSMMCDNPVNALAADRVNQYDLLVGADGIHSSIRNGLFGANLPTFTGNVAWRGLIPAADLPAGMIRPMATAWWGPGKHLVHYFVRRGDWVNVVCVVEKTGWELESWTQKGDLDELKRDFAAWHPDVTRLLAAMNPDECFKWALFDRLPMNSWHKGPVVLLGDACHPTLPFMAQGAAMAIEDGAVMAACLRSESTLAAALNRYEKLRLARTAGIQRGSRRNATVFHLSGTKAWLRDLAAGKAGSAVTDGIYQHNVYEAFEPGAHEE